MRKLTKTVSLILALVLVISVMAPPAFALDFGDPNCRACKSGIDYSWFYAPGGTGELDSANWRHTCSIGPCIYGNNNTAERNLAIREVEDGRYTIVYYMDVNGDLYTDMPRLGGTLIARNGTDEYNEALYGSAVIIRNNAEEEDKSNEAAPDDNAACSTCNRVAETGDPSKNFVWGYNDDGTVRRAYWGHDCTRGPCVFSSETDRDWAINRVKKGYNTIYYYMDASGDLYTDMPTYGGTLVAKNDTAEWDKVLYGSGRLPTYWENYWTTWGSYGMNKPDSTSVGFTDVADSAWYATAVNTLANSDILHGYGNGKFGPEDTMTWEHIYYVLFGLLGLENGYMPATLREDGVATFYTKAAIVNQLLCLDPGDIFDTIFTNDITKFDYNQPVNRAQATALVTLVYSMADMNADAIREYSSSAEFEGGAVIRARQAVANGRKEWTWDDIPDGELAKTAGRISPVSGVNDRLIPLAYTIGIVKGVDDIGTLNASADLTRAEFCQMLYNAGIFGCTYPVFVGGILALPLLNYMQGHCIDGTPVEGYEHIGDVSSFG